VKPEVVNVSKFFARPRTAAALMHEDFLEATEVRRRSSLAAALAKQIALERNQRWLGWMGEILIDEKGKRPGSWIGRNSAYKPITVKSRENFLGEPLQVCVEKIFATYLSATVKRNSKLTTVADHQTI
jgi:tRNA A37 methylthiotransferase MiaB